MEFALRFAKSVAKREKVIYLNEGYHGLSLGAQSVSTFGRWACPKVEGTYGFSVPRTQDEVDPCISTFEELLSRSGDEIAAFILEPVLGAGGMILPPVRFFERVRRLCEQRNIILIFDECQTGFGRTGKWFCYQQYGVEPDALIFAKAGGAGFPVSGVLFRKPLVDEMKRGNMTHFSSHQNDPLPAAILLFVIKEIERKGILSKVASTGKVLLETIRKIGEKSGKLKDVRGMGLMIGFDLKDELFTANSNAGRVLTNRLISRGIIIQSINRGKTFRVMPNYLISSREIDYFAKHLSETLEEIRVE